MSKKPKIAAATANTKPSVSSNTFLDRFETQTIWHVALIVLLPFFLYIKVVGFELINMDDVAIISNNYDILSHIGNIGIAFKTDAFLGSHGDFYRPIQTVSFMLDTMIGGGKPWIYHFSNLLIHILTSVSLYFFLRFLNIRNLTALLGALFFAVHPLLASAVSWIPARSDLLIGLFGILLFYSFGKYFKTGKKVYFLLHSLLFLLAAFTKETSILFPLLLLFFYWFILKEKFSVKKLLPFFILWFIVLVSFFILRNKVAANLPPSFIFGIDPFINNLPTIPIIAAKTFIPAGLSTMPLFDKVFTAVGLVIFFVLLALAIKNAIKKNWLAIMGLAWFLLFIIPPMFFKLYYSQFLLEYYEHRTYLPLIGIIIMLAAMLNGPLFKTNSRSLLWVCTTVILVFIPLSSLHSDNFKNSISFFSNAAEHNNPGALEKRGEEYFNVRDYANALSDFNDAILMSENQYAPAYYYRGKLNSSAQKNHVAAEEDLAKAISIDSTYIEAYIERANERIFTQNFPGAFADIHKALSLDNRNKNAYYTLGKIYVNTSEFEKAELNFSKTISLDSNYAEVYNDRGFARYKLRNMEGAYSDYNKATQLFPEFMNAYYNKGMIFYETGEPAKAIPLFDTTLALTNNFYFGLFYRGMAKKDLHDLKGACEDWQGSVNLGFTMAQDTINKYCR